MGKPIRNYLVLFSETHQPGLIGNVEFTRKTAKFTAPLTNVTRHTSNGVLYSKERMDGAMAAPFFANRFRNKALYGEADHPSQSDANRYIQVHNKNRSHRHNAFRYEGDLLVGDMETAIGGKGEDFYDFLSQGSLPAFSLRGYGTIAKLPNGQTKEQFNLLCWDWVFTPACQEAWATRMQDNIPMRKYGETELSGGAKIFLQESSAIDLITSSTEIGQGDKKLFQESLTGFNPTKVLYDAQGGVLAYYGETDTVATKVEGKAKLELDEFFKI